MRFIFADRCVRDTVPQHLLFACLYDNKSFTENKQLFWFVPAGKRTILAMLVVTNLTSPSKLTNTVNGVCAYCWVRPCAAARAPQQTQLSLPCKIRWNTPETAKYAVSLQKTCVFANIIALQSVRCKIGALFASKRCEPHKKIPPGSTRREKQRKIFTFWDAVPEMRGTRGTSTGGRGSGIPHRPPCRWRPAHPQRQTRR